VAHLRRLSLEVEEVMFVGLFDVSRSSLMYSVTRSAEVDVASLSRVAGQLVRSSCVQTPTVLELRFATAHQEHFLRPLAQPTRLALYLATPRTSVPAVHARSALKRTVGALDAAWRSIT
jgi:hypothetical protein